MVASTALSEKRFPERAREQEGRRVLRNAATIGAFLASPLHLFLMVRALGPAGYGRWWWTFVLLEAATFIGLLGSDLYVRKTLPRAAPDEATDVVGSALAIATATGLGFGLLLALGAAPIAALQGDARLVPFLTLLAFQPLCWSLMAVLVAALQSHHHLGALAALRGFVIPVLLAVAYLVGWQARLPVEGTLGLMLASSVLSLLLVAWLYARHFPLGATLGAALRPRRVRAALGYGMTLLAPLVLYTLSGKLDLYVVGAYFDPAYVGVYAACLQVSGLVPNVRALFDPIAQAQIGALHGHDQAALGASLRHLARLAAFAIAPAFAIAVAVGQPILGWLMGASLPQAFEPLALLALGHLVAGVAVASWIVPMMFGGRPMALIAAAAGLAKLGLLLWLVPRLGAVGAALATGVGGIIALHGQTWLGARRVGFAPFPAGVWAIVGVGIFAAAGGRWLYLALAARVPESLAVLVAATASLAVLCPVLLALMTAADRTELRKLLGLGHPDGSAGA